MSEVQKVRTLAVILTAQVPIVFAVGCDYERGGAAPDAWSSSLDAEVDDLTGARTGVFRTYGPTRQLIAGRDTIPVTVGYWCELDDDTDPATATDGMFFGIAMPDTSLLSDDEEAFEELSGQLGLLDVARLAVDGRLYAWRYEPTSTLGGWFLDGAMGFEPDDELDTVGERTRLLSTVVEFYNGLSAANLPGGVRSVLHDRALDIVQGVRERWPSAQDYVTSNYVGRDTVGIELKGVLKFPLEGLDIAIDSVRFWCPVAQSHHEWNHARGRFFAVVDSLNAAENERIAEVARRREAQRADESARRLEAQRAAESARRLEAERAEESARRLEAWRAEEFARESARRLEARRQDSIRFPLGTLLRRLPSHRVRSVAAYAEAIGVDVQNRQDLESLCEIWRSNDSLVSAPTRVAMNSACPLPPEPPEENQIDSIRALFPRQPAYEHRAILSYAKANGVSVLNGQDMVRLCEIWRDGDRTVSPLTRVAMDKACAFPTP